jgi:hypothetical protein
MKKLGKFKKNKDKKKKKKKKKDRLNSKNYYNNNNNSSKDQLFLPLLLIISLHNLNIISKCNLIIYNKETFNKIHKINRCTKINNNINSIKINNTPNSRGLLNLNNKLISNFSPRQFKIITNLPFSNTQINNSSQSLILNKITNKIAISHS